MYPTINGILGLEQIIAAAANSELVPNQGRGLVHRKLVEAPPPPPPPPPSNFIAGRPKAALLFLAL